MTPTSEMRAAAERFNRIVDLVEARCLATDGPVTPTLKEMREEELSDLWRSVQTIKEGLALLDEVEALRARVERLSPLVRTETAPSETAIQVQLAAEVERLRAAADEFLRVDEQISHANRYGRDPGQEAYDDWAEKRGRLRALLTPAAEKV